jgi:hypothetical protein
MDKNDFTKVFEVVKHGYIDSCKPEIMIFKYSDSSEIMDDCIAVQAAGFQALANMGECSLSVRK